MDFFYIADDHPNAVSFFLSPMTTVMVNHKNAVQGAITTVRHAVLA